MLVVKSSIKIPPVTISEIVEFSQCPDAPIWRWKTTVIISLDHVVNFSVNSPVNIFLNTQFYCSLVLNFNLHRGRQGDDGDKEIATINFDIKINQKHFSFTSFLPPAFPHCPLILHFLLSFPNSPPILHFLTLHFPTTSFSLENFFLCWKLLPHHR